MASNAFIVMSAPFPGRSIHLLPPEIPTERLRLLNIMLESDKPEHGHFLAGKVSQCVKGLAAKVDSLSSIPGTHMVEGENWFLLSCPLTYTCAPRHIQLHVYFST